MFYGGYLYARKAVSPFLMIYIFFHDIRADALFSIFTPFNAS